MRILAVVGSPRRGGNTEILVDEVLRGARDAGGLVEKVFLNDLDIKPCQAECSDHCRKVGECKIHDEMQPLYNKIYNSDVIILGTPLYWYGPSAQLKTFIDRWYAFSHPEHVGRVKGKKVILISTFEESNTSAADPLISMISKSLDYLEAKFHAKLLVSAGEKGAVKQNRRAMAEAYKIGFELRN